MDNKILDADFADKEGNRVDKLLGKGEIIKIRSFSFEQKANMYKLTLDNEGIPNFLSNANTTNALSGYTIGIGGIGMHIRKMDAQKVLDLFERLDKNVQSEEIDPEMKELFENADNELVEMKAEQEKSQQKYWTILIGTLAFMYLLFKFLEFLA